MRGWQLRFQTRRPYRSGATATGADVATAEKNVTDTINKALASVKAAAFLIAMLRRLHTTSRLTTTIPYVLQAYFVLRRHQLSLGMT